ncbi:MAG: ABC transporter permease [Acidobacteria bacterium]|nr:MAG: ABC transporter permease [Acidobacteriota bacterium]
MNRIFIVAQSEFLTLVKTKAFIIGLLLMPVITAGAIGFQIYAQKHSDRDDHKFVVIDHTGVLFTPLQTAANAFNAKNGEGATRTGPHFVPEAAAAPADADAYRLALSEQVKQKQLFGFVEIPAGVVDPNVEKAPSIQYYTETPSYDRLPDWLQQTLNEEITRRRFDTAGVDQALVKKLSARADVQTMGLVGKKADGSVEKAKEVDPIATFVAPFAVLFIMFLSVMSSAPQLLNAVIEEKMSRISEVLVASVSPFELLLGKLFGVTAVAVLLALVYFLGAGYYMIYSGRTELVQPALMAWFVIFLICCVLMFGSMFLAIGSACSDLKDAQSMMQPVMMLLMVGYIGSFAVLRAPESPVALTLSFFPTSAPFIMMLRMAMQPTPPLWQPALSLALTLVTTVGFVWAASRIFRVGVLMQGKGATFREMLKWIRQA